MTNQYLAQMQQMRRRQLLTAAYRTMIAAGSQKNSTTEPEIQRDPLCFTAIQNESCVSFSYTGDDPQPQIQISHDNNNWTDYQLGYSMHLNDVGDKIYFRAKSRNSFYGDEFNSYAKFTVSGQVSSSGNVMSILSKEEDPNCLTEYCFKQLFDGCEGLVSAPDLPATNLMRGCYQGMFQNCTSLTSVPELPAVALRPYSYDSMFLNCSSLDHLKVKFTNWTTEEGGMESPCANYMMYGTASGGTFECPTALEEIKDEVHIPGDWTVIKR